MTWTLQQARETYAIEQWGEGYFAIGPNGHVVVHPTRSAADGTIDLIGIVDKLHQEGLGLPVLVRFTDILGDRVRLLREAFDTARADLDYPGHYTPVYPIKVNQQGTVVEGILRTGKAYGIGLEAGSKSELLGVMALSEAATLICNGYKDRAYIRLALIGSTLGHNIFIVIEKYSELELILSESQALGITPQLGVRVRLASIGAGKWQNSGGDKSKFGLNAGDLLRLVERLKAEGHLDWLQLLHFHMGSQIANINDVKTALGEACRYYAELSHLGAALRWADVGGGLGIDYEGSHSISECSINYSLDEYAYAIVRAFAEMAATENLAPPHLITESGRAISAHHAVLITDVIDVEQVAEDTRLPTLSSARPVLDLAGLLADLPTEPVLGVYHDAQFDLNEARALYARGQLNLTDLAEAERLHAALSHQVRRRLDVRLRSHREVLDELNERLADKVFCNFSLFQSMPDAWAIEQIFPVMPLQRLHEEPSRRAVIQDLTCDSDGRIEAYIDRQSIEPTLPLHDTRPGERYLIGVFLVGAYQEILGDMHNLFGDTHSINVELDGTGGYRLVAPHPGDGTDDLLRYVHIDPQELERAYRKKLLEAQP
ncbi:biosynthetic arginine decarboxylase, partial [Candidatus Woesearchaeota archaeon]|nr:biosynthetic arginine decarboxylase [Candidatus Woesearchaeota archaeon]